MSPSLGVAIGTTYLPAAAAKVGTKFEVECRGAHSGGGSQPAVLEEGEREEGGMRRMAL